MKKHIWLLYLPFLVMGMLLISPGCKKDDDNKCTQSDWVGTYKGTVTCDGTSEDVTLTITASGAAAIVIKYETANGTTEYDPQTPDGCKLNISGTDGGITATINATLDGSKLTLSESLSGGGITSSCNITVTRM